MEFTFIWPICCVHHGLQVINSNSNTILRVKIILTCVSCVQYLSNARWKERSYVSIILLLDSLNRLLSFYLAYLSSFRLLIVHTQSLICESFRSMDRYCVFSHNTPLPSMWFAELLWYLIGAIRSIIAGSPI